MKTQACRSGWLCAAAFALAVLPGCAPRGALYRDFSPLTGPVTAAPPEILIQSDTIAPDVSQVESFASVRDTLQRPTSDARRGLAEHDAKCLAAQNSAAAYLLETECRAIQAQTGSNAQDQQSASVLCQALLLQGTHERNRSAATALRSFYRLAEAEAGAALLQTSQQLVEQSLEDVQRIKAAGLRSHVNEDQLQREQSELLDQGEELALTTDRLNQHLHMTLGLDDAAHSRIWPLADLTVIVEPVDVDAAIAEGLAHRADLAAQRSLLASLDRSTLPAIRQGLGLAQAGLGASAGASRLLHLIHQWKGQDAEVSVRRRQLTDLTTYTERTIAQEIRSAALSVEARLRQVALAKDTLESWHERLDNLERLLAAGAADPQRTLLWRSERSGARLEAKRAEGELMRHVVEWKIALADLKEAQGLLAVECGFVAATAVDAGRY